MGRVNGVGFPVAGQTFLRSAAFRRHEALTGRIRTSLGSGQPRHSNAYDSLERLTVTACERTTAASAERTTASSSVGKRETNLRALRVTTYGARHAWAGRHATDGSRSSVHHADAPVSASREALRVPWGPATSHHYPESHASPVTGNLCIALRPADSGTANRARRLPVSGKLVARGRSCHYVKLRANERKRAQVLDLSCDD